MLMILQDSGHCRMMQGPFLKFYFTCVDGFKIVTSCLDMPCRMAVGLESAASDIQLLILIISTTAVKR